ncbi:MAG TPA: DUF1963 domain-containing protein [Polyangiaceae bacterium]|nr:DUF1963 domain-containing protein [Polyangiaceae bacterium]
MDADEIRRRFRPWREKHARPAWRPVARGDDRPGASHFGGSPRLAAGEAWPACKGCRRPLQFFLQLDLAACPPPFARRGGGLLQLFYCSRDDGDCETWAPFSGTHLVRVLAEPGQIVRQPKGLEPFAARAVEGWREFTDYPQPSEHEALGLRYDYDFGKNLVSARCDELGLALVDADIDLGVAEAIAAAEAGDKLGGWPAWVQGVEYPSCPKCKRTMQLLLQVDSEDNVPHMFGDVGCGHITRCPEHPDVLAFGWACG